MAGGAPQQHQDLSHAASRGRRFRHFPAMGGVPDIGQQRLRHVRHRKHAGGITGPDGAGRHAVVLGRVRLLHHAQAAIAEDGAQSQGAIAAGSRQDNADRHLSLVLGQGAQEGVDGHALAAGLLGNTQLQGAVKQGHVAVGRNDVDLVGLHYHLVLRFHHRYRRGPLQDFREDTGMAGVEMRHQHEGHATVRRQMEEELLEGFQPTGRRAQTDDREGGRHSTRLICAGFPGHHGRLLKPGPVDGQRLRPGETAGANANGLSWAFRPRQYSGDVMAPGLRRRRRGDDVRRSLHTVPFPPVSPHTWPNRPSACIGRWWWRIADKWRCRCWR